MLDRLLEEPWLRIDAISGTSAGAMNAAVLADGGLKAGRQGRARPWMLTGNAWPEPQCSARCSVHRSIVCSTLVARLLASFHRIRPHGAAFSPYDLNPRGFNPLETILHESIDFVRLARSPIKLFITATNVRTGRGHIFRNAEITPDVLMASACLPTMFQAVEIDGEAYWDGGFAGNPNDHSARARKRCTGHHLGSDQSP